MKKIKKFLFGSENFSFSPMRNFLIGIGVIDE